MLGQAALSDLLETSELNIGTRIRRPKLKGGGVADKNMEYDWSRHCSHNPSRPLDMYFSQTC